MSDSTVTLEDVADWIDDNLVDNGPTRDPQDHDRAAALLRAAQKVVEESLRVSNRLAAAISLLEAGRRKGAASDLMYGQMITDYRAANSRFAEALAAFRKEEGE